MRTSSGRRASHVSSCRSPSWERISSASRRCSSSCSSLNSIVLPRARATELLAIPLALLVVCLVSGLALALASLNVLFRDVEFIVAALLVPWFFLTPVIYPLSQFAAHRHVVEVIHWVNPLSPAVEACARRSSSGDAVLGDALYLVVAAAVALALGAYVFTRVDDQIAIEV